MSDKTIGVLLTLALSATACGGDKSGNGGGGGSNKIDACAVVTVDDASTLFGQPATKDTGAQVTDPALLGECLWTYETPAADSHLLQFRVWDGKSYYNPGSKSEPFVVGDQGAIQVDSYLGVDIAWLSGERAVELSYSTVGNVPDATTKVAEMKALALATDSKLP